VVDSVFEQHLEQFVGPFLAHPSKSGGSEDHPGAEVTRPAELHPFDRHSTTLHAARKAVKA
jgi:hypothetical protein